MFFDNGYAVVRFAQEKSVDLFAFAFAFATPFLTSLVDYVSWLFPQVKKSVDSKKRRHPRPTDFSERLSLLHFPLKRESIPRGDRENQPALFFRGARKHRLDRSTR
jgi:hypothetical protein